MNVAGIGTDIVECLRIGRMIEQHGELFLARVYTEREIQFCQERQHSIEHFAGLWAAKEAVLRALGAGRGRGPGRGVARTDLEIRAEPGGQYKVMVRGAAREVAVRRGVSDVLLSIAHCRTYATAYAMAVVGPKPAPEKPGPSE